MIFIYLHGIKIIFKVTNDITYIYALVNHAVQQINIIFDSILQLNRIVSIGLRVKLWQYDSGNNHWCLRGEGSVWPWHLDGYPLWAYIGTYCIYLFCEFWKILSPLQNYKLRYVNKLPWHIPPFTLLSHSLCHVGLSTPV